MFNRPASGQPTPSAIVPRYKVGASLLLPFCALSYAAPGAADPAAESCVDLTLATVQSTLCHSDGKRAVALAVVWVNAARGEFVLKPEGDGTTKGLAPGRYRLDVAITLAATVGGDPVVLCSDTLWIELVGSETLRGSA